MRGEDGPPAFFVSASSSLYSLVDIGLVPLCHQGQNFLVGWVDRFEGLARFRRYPLAANQQLHRRPPQKVQHSITFAPCAARSTTGTDAPIFTTLRNRTPSKGKRLPNPVRQPPDKSLGYSLTYTDLI